MKTLAFMVSVLVFFAAPVSVWSADNALKGKADLETQLLEMCKLPPDYSSAVKWFNISKKVKADDLRQLALKASAAALWYVDKRSVYNSKVKSLIDDPRAFEASLTITCPKCEGEKSLTSECKTCTGTGRCSAQNCTQGYRPATRINLGRGFGTSSEWTKCTECKGTARCKKCNGSGQRTVKCKQCNGRGVVYNREATVKAYRDCLNWISTSLED